jgi:arsenate reductase
MAAGLLRSLAGDAIDVRSAGSAPADEVNPAVVEVMAEVGVDLADSVPSMLEADDVRVADVVVTMGCGDACPVFPGTRYLDWDLPDPSGLTPGQVRPIRDEIERLVRALAGELVGAGGRS